MRKIGIIVTMLTAITITMAVAWNFFESPARAQVETPIEISTGESREPVKIDCSGDGWDEEPTLKRIRTEERALLEARVSHARAAASDSDEVERPTKARRGLKLIRFPWESPIETRGKLWNVPPEESMDATLEGFLRICMAESDGRQEDCIGIWQVLTNIRRRSCAQRRITRITECEVGFGETYLSVMRRSQRHILGFLPLRNARARWISKMTIDCERPDEYPGTQERWDGRQGPRCRRTVALGRLLLEGELPPSAPGRRSEWLPGRPITWGGRCETGRGACDDEIACRRGLARIPDTNTLNAFWCRPGSPGCSDDIDPICLQMGFKSLRDPA